MAYWSDFGLWDERHKDLLREAEGARLAGTIREAGGTEEKKEASRSDGVVVRWGLSADDEMVADLFELNGMPRWAAFEERFVVAEEGGRIVAAARYRTEKGRLVLGVFVADPWAGERRIAVALYSGVRELAREICAREVWATDDRYARYPREAGYTRRGGVWRLDAEEDAAALPAGGVRKWISLLGSTAVPFFRPFTH